MADCMKPRSRGRRARLLSSTALSGLAAALMPAAVRAVMLPIALLALGNAAQANCDGDGNITGANVATIVLGSGGCADAIPASPVRLS